MYLLLISFSTTFSAAGTTFLLIIFYLGFKIGWRTFKKRWCYAVRKYNAQGTIDCRQQMTVIPKGEVLITSSSMRDQCKNTTSSQIMRLSLSPPGFIIHSTAVLARVTFTVYICSPPFPLWTSNAVSTLSTAVNGVSTTCIACVLPVISVYCQSNTLVLLVLSVLSVLSTLVVLSVL